LDFKILDASAFYAGIPFGSSSKYYTTSMIFEEIKHIKKNHDAIGLLLETKRLEVMDPKDDSTSFVESSAKKSGDYDELSKEDISSIALCYELKGELITDDFAASNVAKNLGLTVIPVMTSGIKTRGVWIHYCPACKKSFSNVTVCSLCGNRLRKKLKPSQV
jgi:UPF0271 protein